MNHEIFSHNALHEKYTIEKRLGHGSQGTMYLAHTSNGSPCAIKAFNLRTIPNWKSNELMMREIDTLRTLDVEHVPKCLDVIDASSDPHPYIFVIQQFVNGKSLLDLINNGHRFTIADILNMMKDISKILLELSQYYHIIHRDIKPSNIMIDESGSAWLVDFGSVVKSVKHEGGSTIAGTAGYMAPEQALGDAVAVSDVYALGMTVIHVLTGHEPYEFEQKNLRPVYQPFLPQMVPAWLVTLLDHMVEPFALRRATIKEVYNLTANGDPKDTPFVYSPVEDTVTDAPDESQCHTMAKIPLYLRLSPEFVFIISSQLSLLLLCLITFSFKLLGTFLIFYISMTVLLFFIDHPILKILLSKSKPYRDDD